MRFEHQLRAIRLRRSGRIDALEFAGETIALAAEDAVILAVPPYIAATLVRGLDVPTEFRAIVNAHFRVEPPPGQPRIIGVLNATTEWIFAFPGRLSVTVSAGDRLIDAPREDLAKTIWAEVAAVARLPLDPLPPWQIVRERRATFAATPEQDCKAPGHSDFVAESCPRRRLDKYRLARDHRRCHPIRQSRCGVRQPALSGTFV